MLKKPYQHIYSIDENNYYLLDLEKNYYLVTEGVFSVEQKGLFKNKTDSVAHSLKVLSTPIPLLDLFRKFCDIKPNTIGNDDEMTDTTFDILDIVECRKSIDKAYKEAQQSRVDAIKDSYDKLIGKETDKTITSQLNNEKMKAIDIIKSQSSTGRYDFLAKASSRNEFDTIPVIVSLATDGYIPYYVYNSGSRTYDAYLVKNDEFGKIEIVKISLFKGKNNYKVKFIEQFIYDKYVINAYLTKIFGTEVK